MQRWSTLLALREMEIKLQQDITTSLSEWPKPKQNKEEGEQQKR